MLRACCNRGIPVPIRARNHPFTPAAWRPRPLCCVISARARAHVRQHIPRAPVSMEDMIQPLMRAQGQGAPSRALKRKLERTAAGTVPRDKPRAKAGAAAEVVETPLPRVQRERV